MGSSTFNFNKCIMIGTFSLFIAFLLVLPPPLINGGTLNQLRLRGYPGGAGKHRAEPGGGAVRGGGDRAGAPPRHPGHLLQHQAGPLQYRPPVLQHQAGPLQLPNAAKDVLATLGNGTGTIGVINGLSQNPPNSYMTCTLYMNEFDCSRATYKFTVPNERTRDYTDSNPNCTYQSLRCLPSGRRQTSCMKVNPEPKIYT